MVREGGFLTSFDSKNQTVAQAPRMDEQSNQEQEVRSKLKVKEILQLNIINIIKTRKKLFIEAWC
jgi:hypothetical protein